MANVKSTSEPDLSRSWEQWQADMEFERKLDWQLEDRKYKLKQRLLASYYAKR